MTYTPSDTTVRAGIVGPGSPGTRVFESNFVVECPCGFRSNVATTSLAFAEEDAERHRRAHTCEHFSPTECFGTVYDGRCFTHSVDPERRGDL
jgi:hypothetical protein